jgi:cytochrome P450
MFSRGTLFGKQSMLVNDPEGVREIAAGDARGLFVKNNAARRLVRPIVGQGLLLSENEQWRKQRRMLAPVFTPAHVNLFLSHFNEAARSLIAGLRDGAQANFAALMQDTALDAACRALFSVSIGGDGKGKRLAALARYYGAGPGRPSLWDFLAQKEDDFYSPRRAAFRVKWRAEVKSIIEQRRNQPPKEGPRDLLDILLSARDPDSGEGLSDEEIEDQTSTFLAAGFETTARTMFWTIYLLSLDREEQARIRAEVRAAPPDTLTELAGLKVWPRLRQALLEAMRLYPPVPLYTRVATADVVVCGEKLAAGTVLLVSPWLIHRHTKLWDNPNAFLPDRFAGKPNDFLSNGAFIPFGTGPRVCIGATFALAEASIVIARLLERFDIALDDAREVMPVAILTTAPSIEPNFRVTAIN